jgi:hypothetical protein
MFEPMGDAREAFNKAFKIQIRLLLKPAPGSAAEDALDRVVGSVEDKSVPFNGWDPEDEAEDPPRWEGDAEWDRWKKEWMETALKAYKAWTALEDRFMAEYCNSNHDYCWKAVERVRQMQA